MKITLMTFGSRGDVQPFLALAVALRGRGHSVRLAAPTDFEAQARAYDIPCTSIAFDVREMSERFASVRTADRGVNPALLIAAWREVIPEIKRAFFSAAFTYAEAANDADLIISHGFLVPLAYSIRQHLQTPLMLGIAGPIATTRMFPSPMFPSTPFGQRFYNPLTFKLLVRGVTTYMIAPVNNYRQQVGLPKLSAGKLNGILLTRTFPCS
ncbi:MAG: glycosyltransferase [Anaerolineae bacterium]